MEGEGMLTRETIQRTVKQSALPKLTISCIQNLNLFGKDNVNKAFRCMGSRGPKTHEDQCRQVPKTSKRCAHLHCAVESYVLEVCIVCFLLPLFRDRPLSGWQEKQSN